MENTLKEAADGLNHLIVIANDGKEGYAQAADYVGDTLLKGEFLRYSTQRDEFADELRTLVAATGTNPETGGGPVGAIHRVWVDIITSFVTNDKEAILKECIRGEETAVSAYVRVLKDNVLTEEQQNILQKQLKLTRDALFDLTRQLKQTDGQ
jgi:uncharacterized protein (TIGR02284 family)